MGVRNHFSLQVFLQKGKKKDGRKRNVNKIDDQFSCDCLFFYLFRKLEYKLKTKTKKQTQIEKIF